MTPITAYYICRKSDFTTKPDFFGGLLNRLVEKWPKLYRAVKKKQANDLFSGPLGEVCSKSRPSGAGMQIFLPKKNSDSHALHIFAVRRIGTRPCMRNPASDERQKRHGYRLRRKKREITV